MKDLNRVMEIWLNTSIEAHPFLDAQYFIDNYQSFFEDHLLRSQSQVYEIDGKIVGFVSIKQDMFVTTINVDKDYRLSGVGESLIQALLDKFQAIHVKCFLKDADSLAFFTKCGFEVSGHETDALTGEELVILTAIGQRTQH